MNTDPFKEFRTSPKSLGDSPNLSDNNSDGDASQEGSSFDIPWLFPVVISRGYEYSHSAATFCLPTPVGFIFATMAEALPITSGATTVAATTDNTVSTGFLTASHFGIPPIPQNISPIQHIPYAPFPSGIPQVGPHSSVGSSVVSGSFPNLYWTSPVPLTTTSPVVVTTVPPIVTSVGQPAMSSSIVQLPVVPTVAWLAITSPSTTGTVSLPALMKTTQTVQAPIFSIPPIGQLSTTSALPTVPSHVPQTPAMVTIVPPATFYGSAVQPPQVQYMSYPTPGMGMGAFPISTPTGVYTSPIPSAPPLWANVSAIPPSQPGTGMLPIPQPQQIPSFGPTLNPPGASLSNVPLHTSVSTSSIVDPNTVNLLTQLLTNLNPGGVKGQNPPERLAFYGL